MLHYKDTGDALSKEENSVFMLSLGLVDVMRGYIGLGVVLKVALRDSVILEELAQIEEKLVYLNKLVLIQYYRQYYYAVII